MKLNLEKLFNCTVEHIRWIGDAICDGGKNYNTEGCLWDGGDCCQETCRDTDTQSCLTDKFNCLDPRYKVLITSSPSISPSISPIFSESENNNFDYINYVIIPVSSVLVIIVGIIAYFRCRTNRRVQNNYEEESDDES